MTFQSQSYAEALEKVRSKPVKPRKPLARGRMRVILPVKASERADPEKPCRSLRRGQISSRTAGRKAKKGKRVKLRSMKALKKLVWHHFSIFIRTSAADMHGYVDCVTCGAVHLWDSGEIHAGHWMHNKLDFDERQIHPQCRTCNYYWRTNVNTAYSVFMAKTYGAEVMEELQLLANTKGNKYSRAELDELLAKYKALNAVNPLVAEKGE